MKVLFIGDVVGPSGVRCVERGLSRVRRETGADLVIVNGENAAENNGIDAPSAERIAASGADVITTGNHAFRCRGVETLYEDGLPGCRVLRPANFPPPCPGECSAVVETPRGRALVMSVMGVAFMEPLTPPMVCAARELERRRGEYDFAIIDLHGESSGEKAAFAHWAARSPYSVAAVFGTHTHVATSDARIIAGGVAFVTDVGMTGPDDSILGVETDAVVERYATGRPARFRPASGPSTAHGALAVIERGRAVSIEAITFR
jgi:metallophosphoesterase (TIGR00282 family)